MAHAHNQPRTTAHPFRQRALPGLLTALAALAAAFGCLPDPKQNLGPAPAVDANAPDAETAYWLSQYKKNRTVPPREFSVAPKPPRNNEFGEFDDELYTSLDSQPALPQLPGGQDIMPMMGGPAGYPVPAALSPRNRVAAGGAVSGVRSASTRSGSARSSEGIEGETHFYPIEQLVFGGDYSDMDKPELYRLMPKDAISVTVKDHPEFSGKLDIQPDGTVRIANTPDLIRLRGLTVDEAAEEIRRILQVYVKGECVVRVQANRARGGYYFVFGDVNQPGRFPMGLEPVKLSDAILAANWEANPNRMAEDDELGPAFPAAGPRGSFNAPASADLARVMLITPHRSQPVRTTHDIRSAMLGMTGNNPAVRPGQIIVVPSLDPGRNAALGLVAPPEGAMVPDALMPGQGFSNAGTAPGLPAVNPDSHPARRRAVVTIPDVEGNMTNAYGIQANTPAVYPDEEVWYGVSDDGGMFEAPEAAAPVPEAFEETRSMAAPEMRSGEMDFPRGSVEGVEQPRRRRGRRLARPELSGRPDPAGVKRNLDGWNKGF